MKSNKNQWKPKIKNVMKNGNEICTLDGYAIPTEHRYYNILKGLIERRK